MTLVLVKLALTGKRSGGRLRERLELFALFVFLAAARCTVYLTARLRKWLGGVWLLAVLLPMKAYHLILRLGDRLGE